MSYVILPKTTSVVDQAPSNTTGSTDSNSSGQSTQVSRIPGPKGDPGPQGPRGPAGPRDLRDRLGALHSFSSEISVRGARVDSTGVDLGRIDVREYFDQFNIIDPAVDDCTAAINATLTVGSGKHIHFPPGIYRCKGIQIPDGTTVTGTGATLLWDDSTLNGTPIISSVGANVTIDNLMFDGQRLQGSPLTADAHVDDLSITVSDGTQFFSGDRIELADSTGHVSESHTISTVVGSVLNLTTPLTAEHVIGDMVGISTGWAQNYTGRSYRGGIVANGGSTNTGLCDGLTLRNLRFVGLYGAGIVVQSASDVSVSGCSAQSCNFELLFGVNPGHDSYNWTITGCQARDMHTPVRNDSYRNDGLVIDGVQGVTLTGFVLTDWDGSCKIEACDGWSVQGCIFDSNVTHLPALTTQVGSTFGDIGGCIIRNCGMGFQPTTDSSGQNRYGTRIRLHHTTIDTCPGRDGFIGEGIQAGSYFGELEISDCDIRSIHRYPIQVSYGLTSLRILRNRIDAGQTNPYDGTAIRIQLSGNSGRNGGRCIIEDNDILGFGGQTTSDGTIKLDPGSGGGKFEFVSIRRNRFSPRTPMSELQGGPLCKVSGTPISSGHAYKIAIDSVAGGTGIEQATFSWYEDGVLQESGVTASATPHALGSTGMTARFFDPSSFSQTFGTKLYWTWITRTAPGVSLSAVSAWPVAAPVISMGGTPISKDYRFRFEIDSIAGGTGLGQATFRWSSDGGVTYTQSGVVTQAGYSLGSTGCTVTFVSGTYATTHYWQAGAQVSDRVLLLNVGGSDYILDGEVSGNVIDGGVYGTHTSTRFLIGENDVAGQRSLTGRHGGGVWRRTQGPTATRPCLIGKGDQHYDTTLNQVVWFNGTRWVNAALTAT